MSAVVFPFLVLLCKGTRDPWMFWDTEGSLSWRLREVKGAICEIPFGNERLFY